MYFYFWSGRADCSIHQKTLCKSLYAGDGHPELQSESSRKMPLFKVHVVLRRRSTGQMVTAISRSQPNEIDGEDSGKPEGTYEVEYVGYGLHLDEPNHAFLMPVLTFKVYSLDKADGATDDQLIARGTPLRFSTRSPGTTNEESLDDLPGFRFDLVGADEGDAVEDILLNTMRTWKWG